MLGTYYCTWSVQHDLMGTRTSRMPGVQNPVTASIALGYAIEGTARWQKGTVTNTATAGASMYDMDGWEAVSVLVENWGGEVDATIEVIGDEITARKVDLYSAQGDQDAKRRFDFGADLKSVHRRIADGPLYCRITPRGKGEQTDDGYGRKVRITEVNQGKDYLENSVMVDLAKLPDGNGGWEYPTLEVENSNCETPEQLKEWALTVLDEYTKPNVSYEVDVLQAAAEGVDMQGVSLGDSVQIVDRKFGDGLRLAGRVLEMSVNMLDERDAKLTIGNVDKGIVQVFGDLKERLDTVSKTVWNMNGGTYSTTEYMSELVARINGEINMTGGYTYITEGQGLRTYDRAVTDPLVGDEADAVVEIKGGTVRIANSRTAQGDWEWKTVFTSGHIAANLVTAAQITTGYIGSSGGTYIDLDGNTVQLGPDSMLHATLNNNAFELWTPQGTYASRSTLHLGYGLVRSNYDVDVNGPYFTLGERKSDYVIGYYSYSEGENNAVTKAYSHAEGYGHKVSSSYAHAEGSSNTVSGAYAHAEGRSNTASGVCSHAGGYNCTASGDYSFAMGNSATATSYSAAFGEVVKASAFNQFACGKYNAYSSGPFVVGYGTNVGNEKNVLELSGTGNLWIAGTLTQGSDRRLKEHHAYLGDEACEFVRRLEPALYTKDGERHVGFYAQNVRDVEPEGWDTVTVTERHTDESLDFDPLSLDYTAIIAPLVKYAQSLEERIDQLEARLAALEGRDA